MFSSKKVAICILDDNDKVLAKRDIETEWSPKLEKSFKMHGLDVNTELSDIIWGELRKYITRKTVHDLLIESEKNETTKKS